MQDAILIAAVAAVFIIGYFVMSHLDRYLDENRRGIENADEKKEPSCVLLTDELSTDELLEEIRAFKSSHRNTKILLYDGSNPEVHGETAGLNQTKQ